MPGRIDIGFATNSDVIAFSDLFRAVAGALTLYNERAKRVEFEKYAPGNVPAILAPDPHSIFLAFISLAA